MEGVAGRGVVDVPAPALLVAADSLEPLKNKPAPDNLVVPPYKYLSDSVVLIGEDKA